MSNLAVSLLSYVRPAKFDFIMFLMFQEIISGPNKVSRQQILCINARFLTTWTNIWILNLHKAATGTHDMTPSVQVRIQ